MKKIKHLAAVMATLGLLIMGCAHESVNPTENQAPALEGLAGDPHPALDTVCQETDTIFLIRQDNGSPKVDKCYGLGGVPVACPPSMALPWGHLVMREGYFDGDNYVDCNFSMAPGWYCDLNNWQFGLQNDFQFDQNGIPVIDVDWGSKVVNPSQNKWQLRLMVADLESPCFYVALRVNAVKLNLFGLVVNGSSTLTWGRNNNWNNPSHAQFSGNQWLTRFCPARCMETPPPPVDSSCVALYTGVSALGNCTTLHANTTGLTGSLAYEWSTGATTPSVTVCPTATTTYTVTISGSGGAPVAINAITVNHINAACGNGNNAGSKIWVCHVPPGNPGNSHDICISWSGVPAHVARFRAPGSNPHQGHDSGCEIGRCGSNPCL
jgi:hypothetical protein